MQIKSSTVLRNNYGEISSLAHQSREPIYITKNGDGDIVVMSIDAFEEREKMLEHRASVLEAEFSRLSGEPVYSVDQARARLKEKYSHG
jgi:prevent-host-death family protein